MLPEVICHLWTQDEAWELPVGPREHLAQYDT
jgi:hypothetical protein